MGGHVFAKLSSPLQTPRMPAEVYTNVRDWSLLCLRRLYKYAESPVEAPGKESYGDVDVLVCEAITPSTNAYPFESLMTALGGVNFVKATNTLHVAIEWPKEFKALEPSKGPNNIQIDVNFVSDYEQFKWDLFQQAHGDIWSIFGGLIRPYGLTVNNHGLNLRIPEIEKLDKKKSMVRLSKKPDDVLRFLGYGEDAIAKYWRGFSTPDEMFNFVMECRFFYIRSNQETEINGQGDESNELGAGKRDGMDTNGQNNETASSSGVERVLNSKERQRLATRGLYRKWIEEFLPKAVEDGMRREQVHTREGVRQFAFESFGVEKEYMSRLEEWELAIVQLEEQRERKRKRREEAAKRENKSVSPA